MKRRSSFEPEAAEEVKEAHKEDTDENKGFSKWDSISRSVTPPAPSGTVWAAGAVVEGVPDERVGRPEDGANRQPAHAKIGGAALQKQLGSTQMWRGRV